MAERPARPRRRSKLTIGVGWALRGVLESEAGVDLALASQSEPPPFFEQAMEEWRESFDEAGVPISLAESDAILAGLLRAGVLAGRRVVAFFSERGLRQAFDALYEAARAGVAEGGGGVIVAVQSEWRSGADRARETRPFDVREIASMLGWTVLAPSSPSELMRYVNEAMRISRTSGSVTVIAVTPDLAGAAETEPTTAERSLRPGLGATDSGLDAAVNPVHLEVRRRRLDEFINPPAPGEKVQLGFVTSGTAHTSLRQALYMLGLSGRIPILKLACASPVDMASLRRLLERVENVIVVESGSPLVERETLAAAREIYRSVESAPHLTSLRRMALERGVESPAIADPHPSLLIDVLGEYLQDTRPVTGPGVAERLAEWRALARPTLDLEFPRYSRVRSTRDIAETLSRLVLRELSEELAQPAADRPVIDLRVESLDAVSLEEREGVRTVIDVERRRLASVGRAAIAHAMRRRLPITFLVLPDPPGGPRSLSSAEADRLVRSLVISDETSNARISTVDPADGAQLRADLREAVLGRSVSVLILDIDPYARRGSGERGPWGELGLTADELLTRPSSPRATVLYEWLIRRGWNDTGLLDGRHGPKIDLPDLEDPLMTPLDGWDGFEEFQVRRRGDNLESSSATRPEDLAEPIPQHSSSAIWRAHIAGPAGAAFDDTIVLLEQAGRRMGYRVQSLQASDTGGVFRQILFSRPRENEPPLPVSPRIATGDADLVIALDLESLFCALEQRGGHRIASPQRSWLVLDLSPSLETILDPTRTQQRPTVPGELNRVIPPTRRAALRAADTADRLFSNRRLVGVILLGVAFQMGLIPVTADTINRAAARSLSDPPETVSLALEIGRRIAETGGIPIGASDDRAPRPEAMVRRHHRIMASRKWPFATRRADEFHALALGALDAVTGLRRTDPARLAERRFIARLIDCERWGGLALCRAYAMRIRALYAAERSVTDYPITRLAIQELAHALLIADPFFVAATALRPDRLRGDERRLRLNRAAGDRLRFRLWTRTPGRFRVMLGGVWRIGPGMSGVLARLRPLRLTPWYRRPERAHRQWVEQLVDQCCGELPIRASLWLEIFRQLGRVRGCGVSRRVIMGRVQSTVSALLELGRPDSADSAASESASGMDPSGGPPDPGSSSAFPASGGTASDTTG